MDLYEDVKDLHSENKYHARKTQKIIQVEGKTTHIHGLDEFI